MAISEILALPLCVDGAFFLVDAGVLAANGLGDLGELAGGHE